MSSPKYTLPTLPQVRDDNGTFYVSTMKEHSSHASFDEAKDWMRERGFNSYNQNNETYLNTPTDHLIKISSEATVKPDQAIENVINQLKGSLDKLAVDNQSERYFLGEWDVTDELLKNIVRMAEQASSTYREDIKKDPIFYGDMTENEFIVSSIDIELSEKYDLWQGHRNAASEAMGYAGLYELAESHAAACKQLYVDDCVDLDHKLSQRIEEIITDRIDELDTSTPLNIIHDRSYVAMNYILPFNQPGNQNIEDHFIKFNDSPPHLTNVVIDDDFMELLKLLRVSPKNLKSLVKENFSYEDVLHFKDIDQFEPGNTEYSLPPVISIIAKNKEDDLVSIMENTNGYSTATYAAKINAKDFILRDRDQPMILEDGVVGLHDFVNGSGHMVNIQNPIEIPSNAECWNVDGDMGYGIDAVHGFSDSAWTTEFDQPSSGHSQHLTVG
ncbi:MAG: hypothetical protein QM500_21295 [Methylococcales bacterium]